MLQWEKVKDNRWEAEYDLGVYQILEEAGKFYSLNFGKKGKEKGWSLDGEKGLWMGCGSLQEAQSLVEIQHVNEALNFILNVIGKYSGGLPYNRMRDLYDFSVRRDVYEFLADSKSTEECCKRFKSLSEVDKHQILNLMNIGR